MQEIMGPRDFGSLSQLYMVFRESWGAMEPNGAMHKLTYLPNKISMTFTTKTEGCNNTEDCKRIVREIQRREIRDGHPDITFNFLVGNDGHVYEGRGWDKRSPFVYRIGNDKPEFPDQTLEIGYIGDYGDQKWPYEMLVTAIKLINYGVQIKKVNPSYEIV